MEFDLENFRLNQIGHFYLITIPLQLISSSDVGQSGIPSHREAQVFPSLHSNLPIAAQFGPANDVHTNVQVNSS